MTKEFLRMKLADLVPYENNPRHNEEAVDATIASMQQCGNIDPIEVDENNVILSGHTRRLALMKMGYEESDVVRVTGLTDLQKKEVPNPCQQDQRVRRVGLRETGRGTGRA